MFPLFQLPYNRPQISHETIEMGTRNANRVTNEPHGTRLSYAKNRFSGSRTAKKKKNTHTQNVNNTVQSFDMCSALRQATVELRLTIGTRPALVRILRRKPGQRQREQTRSMQGGRREPNDKTLSPTEKHSRCTQHADIF